MIRFAFWEIKSFWQPHRKWISKEGLGLEAGSPLTEFNPQRDGKSLTWGGAEEEWMWASLGVWWPPAWKSGAGEGPVAYTASQTQREGWACVFRAQRQCLAYREGQLYLPASPHSYFLISMAVTSNIFSPPFPDLQTSFLESVLFLFPPLPFRSGMFFSFPFLKKSIYLFIISFVLAALGLVTVCRLSRVAVIRGHCVGFSLQWLLLFQSMGSRVWAQ